MLKLFESLYQREISSTFGHVPRMNIKVDFSTPVLQFETLGPGMIAINIIILLTICLLGRLLAIHGFPLPIG